MTELLTEQELAKQVAYLVEENDQAALLGLIQSQKLAHADMVIGDDVVPLMPRAPGTRAQWDRHLIDTAIAKYVAEQRERNKL